MESVSWVSRVTGPIQATGSEIIQGYGCVDSADRDVYIVDGQTIFTKLIVTFSSDFSVV